MRPKFEQKIPLADKQLLRKFQSNPRQSIKELAEAVGVRVEVADLPSERQAYLDYQQGIGDQDEYVIYVNSGCSKEEMRWAVAHELGHYFLHRDTCGRDYAQFNLSNDQNDYFLEREEEWEANNFAEDLLLPTSWIQRLASKKVFDPLGVARSVAIPSDRAKYRLDYLNRQRKKN